VTFLLLIAASLDAGDGQTRAPARRKPDPETAVITGRVIDAASGRPIDGAVVTLTVQSRFVIFLRAMERPRVSVMTRADGRFTFRNVAAGAHDLQAAGPGYIASVYGQRRPGGSARQVDLDPAEEVSVTIRLWRFGAIAGTIFDEAGEPVVGQEVRALRRVYAGGRYHLRIAGADWTDDRGSYRIGALQPDGYLVVPAITQRAVAASLTESSQAPEGTAIVRIGPALHVIDVDSPVPPLQPGSDRLFIYPALFYAGALSAAQATTIAVSSGEERANVDFQFLPVPAARVSGRAFEALPGAHVVLRLYQAASTDVSDAIVAEAFSDANGAYMFPAVPAGDYLLKALSTTADDNRWASLGFPVGQRDVSNLDFVLRPGLRILGRVDVYGGSPLLARDMHVAIDAADGSVLDVQPAPVTPASRFTIDRLPAGSYVIRVGSVPPGWMVRSISHEGRDVTDTAFALSTDAEVTVTLTNRLTEVFGATRSAAGEPDPDAAVVVFPADRDAWLDVNSSRVRSVRPDRNGEFRVTGLPPGDYLIAAVPAEDMDAADPSIFAELARDAESVRLDEGVKKDVSLKTRAKARR
jgi:hypothetical protein